MKNRVLGTAKAVAAGAVAAEAKARANAERAGERMRKLHADPEFARAHAERMRKLNADPEFARANAEAVSQAQKKRWAEFRRKRALEES